MGRNLAGAANVYALELLALLAAGGDLPGLPSVFAAFPLSSQGGLGAGIPREIHLSAIRVSMH